MCAEPLPRRDISGGSEFRGGRILARGLRLLLAPGPSPPWHQLPPPASPIPSHHLPAHPRAPESVRIGVKIRKDTIITIFRGAATLPEVWKHVLG